MKKAQVILMSYEEFDDVIGLVSNGEAGVEDEMGDWFYTSTENYNVEDIKEDLSNYLHVDIKDILIDLTTDKDDCVVIVYEKEIFKR